MEVNELKDKIIICKDCRREFVYTIWDQKLFGQKGWVAPLRCAVCRQKRRILRKSLEDGLSITDQGMHEAICPKCGIRFFSDLQVKTNENEYCPECWKVIKGF